MTYTIKDTEVNRGFKPELIGLNLEGVASGEYIGIEYKNSVIWFLATEVKEYKEPTIKTNKTAVINAIDSEIWGDPTEDTKEVIKIKTQLRKCTVKNDMDTIEYKYNRLVDLYYLSSKNIIDYRIKGMLRKCMKEILKSNIVLTSTNKDYLNKCVQYGLLEW